MRLLDWIRSVFGRLKPPPAPPPKPPLDPVPLNLASVNARMLDLHNAERARHGRAPLALNNQLILAALEQAQYCARLDLLTHTGHGGSRPGQRIIQAGYAWSACAENAAQQPLAPPDWPEGDVRTPEWAVDGWIKSPGHHANMLGPYVHLGAAWADAKSGTRYWVACFGKPLSP